MSFFNKLKTRFKLKSYQIENDEIQSEGSAQSQEHYNEGKKDNRYVSMPQYRLSSVLIVIEQDPGDHQVLMDEMLDLPSEKINDNPRRFGMDLDTKCTVHISDYATRKQNEILMYLSLSFPAYVDLGNPGGMVITSFGFNGISGQCVECWSGSAIPTSPILRCSNCEKTYDLTRNAALATIDRVSGGDFTTTGPDLVMTVPLPPSDRNYQELKYVIETLLGGKHRRWDCKDCEYVQGYPGSFIYNTFPDVTTA
jgi:hypothetical protein